MISAQDHSTFPALQHVLLLLPRPGAVSATAPVYFCDPPSQAAGYPRYRSQTWDAAAEVGCFVCHPRRRPLAHSDGCPHDPGRVPKDLNESARISERRGHIKSISTKYLSEPNLRPETDDALTCRRQPAPRPCRAPPTLDADRAGARSRRSRGPITFPEQDQKRPGTYVL